MMETGVVSAVQQCTEQEFNAYLLSDGAKIIWSVIHRFGGGLDREEAYQELSIALWRALLAYTPEKKVKISTYVYQAVYNQVKMLLRANSTEKRVAERQTDSVEEQKHLHNDEVDLEEQALEDVIQESRANALRWAIRNSDLTKDEYIVIIRTLEDKAQIEIASEIGASQSHVSVLKARAISKIRETLLDAQWDGVGIWAPDYEEN